MNSKLALPADEIHLWYCSPNQVQNEAVLKSYLTLLNPEELARYHRFAFEKDRKRHLVTRALVRSVLSFYAPVAPRDWCFGSHPKGRPYISGPQLERPLYFNLSHTAEMVVCACARFEEIGIDVENIQRGVNLPSLAESCFSKDEYGSFLQDPVELQQLNFFKNWTLKESYMKACGLGISLPLEQMSIQFRKSDPIQISFGKDIEDDPKNWEFHLETLQEVYQVALAIKVQPGIRFKIVRRNWS